MRQIRDPKVIDQLIKEYEIGNVISNINSYKDHLYVLKMERSDFIQTGDDHDDCLYFYLKGKFKVYAEIQDGRRKLLRFCEGPMLLGEVEFLRYEDKMSGCIEAVGPGIILALNHTHIREELLSDVKLLRFLCDSFAEKMANFGKQQTANAVSYAEEKIWDYMVRSVDKTGMLDVNLRVVAEELDISYRHLHRLLSSFVERGMMQRIGHKYQILKK